MLLFFLLIGGGSGIKKYKSKIIKNIYIGIQKEKKKEKKKETKRNQKETQ